MVEETSERPLKKSGLAALQVKEGGRPAVALPSLGVESLLRPSRRIYGGEGRRSAETAVRLPGCGNPAALAQLEAGRVVLDLGSGSGIDVCCRQSGSARPERPMGSI